MGIAADFWNEKMVKYSKYFKYLDFDDDSRMWSVILKDDIQKKMFDYREQHPIEQVIQTFPSLCYNCGSRFDGAYCAGWGLALGSSGIGPNECANLVFYFSAESDLFGWCEEMEIDVVQVSENELNNMTEDEQFDLAKKYGAVDKMIGLLDGIYDDVEKLMSV